MFFLIQTGSTKEFSLQEKKGSNKSELEIDRETGHHDETSEETREATKKEDQSTEIPGNQEISSLSDPSTNLGKPEFSAIS